MMRTLHLLMKCLAMIIVFTTAAHAEDRHRVDHDRLVDSMVWKKKFRTEMQEQGFYNPRAPRNFKVGVPLMQFGDSGPHLMLGYAPRLKQVDARKVALIYITINLD